MDLTRGARVTGAALCAVLAALTAAWIAMDLRTVRQPLDLWWFWAGDGRTAAAHRPSTSLLDPVLLIGYAVTAAVALRSRCPAGALAAAGAVTLAVRLPGLWLLSTQWAEPRATGGLRTRALITVFAAVGLSAGLITTAAAGRTAAGPACGRTPVPHPSRAACFAVSLLLGTAAAILAAWEVHWATQIPAGSYADRFTGSANAMLPLLGTPPGWFDAALVLVSLTAAGGVLLGTAFARPFALAAAGLLTTSGAAGCALAVRFGLASGFGALPLRDQLTVVSWLFELAAGAAVLRLTARAATGSPAGGTPPPARGRTDDGLAPDVGLPPGPDAGFPPSPPVSPPSDR